jgi:hypothetical protein
MKSTYVIKLVNTLKSVSRKTVDQKYAFAKLLHQASTMDWGTTQYSTFTEMVETELPNLSTEVHKLIHGYVCMQKFKWPMYEQLYCLHRLGWTKFVAAMNKETTDLGCTAFTKKYKAIPMSQLVDTKAVATHSDRAYFFRLPDPLANKLDGILAQYGMTTVAGRKHGMRDSVIALLNTL